MSSAMTDEELKQACEAWIQRYFLFGTSPTLLPGGLSVALQAFARRMQAVGLRRAGEEALRYEVAWPESMAVEVKRIASWCEAEAQKLEGP